MNQPDSGPAPVESPPPPPAYKDRSAGLLVFGVLTILLGCLAGLFALFMLAAPALARVPNAPPTVSILPAVAMYGVLAVVLVWLGIGSIMARRWARALLLVCSWIWLVMGVFIMIVLSVYLPPLLANMPNGATTGQPSLPSAAIGLVMVFEFLITGVLFVILPGVWVFFYKSQHVKATCEARDPVTRWTDACPLPVLALCLFMMAGVPACLLMAMTGHAVMPFFGVFLTGLSGSMFSLAVAAIWSYGAWDLYKLERRGWWFVFIAICVIAASSLVTFARHDMMEMYRQMNYSEAQIEQIQMSGLLVASRMEWIVAFSMLPFLGYLLFIRKYMRR